MNRKQAGIIVTLLALIICTGILASRVNSEFKGGMDDLTTISSKESSTDFFFDSRSVREQQDAKLMENLNAIIADENTSAEQKQDATNELAVKTTAMDSETRVELSIKSKGYEDALCFIDGNKARVVIKNAEELSQDQANAIQDIVINVAKIYDVEIESK